jgi:hypothetical protein
MTELTGKKLGIAVAREVMGWTELQPAELQAAFDSEDMEAIAAFYPYWTDPGYDCLYVYTLADSDNPYVDRRWAPWRSMDDAWEVVEKLRQDGWRFCLSDFASIYGEQWKA